MGRAASGETSWNYAENAYAEDPSRLKIEVMTDDADLSAR